MRRIFSGKDKSKKTRKEIEAEAFAQMRKAKASIDPGVLVKVRSAIQNSPMANKLMGNVALKDTEEKKSIAITTPPSVPVQTSVPKVEANSEAVVAPKASVQSDIKKEKEMLAKKEKALLAAKKAHAGVKESVPVDQSKMLDIVAKMIELNPHKDGLKNGVKNILKGK